MHVYLAGPIADCTEGEANDWRKHAIDYLGDYNIIGVSPLRCELPEDGKYEGGAAFKEVKTRDYFKTAKAINMKNRFDFDNCDVVLAYLPASLNKNRTSIGTLFEVAWAAKEGK